MEPSVAGFCILLYAAYHVFLYYRFRKNPLSTTVGHNHAARKLWCQMVMKERRDILAVQTIRNTLMSSSLLASTSLTLSAVVAAYLVNTVQSTGLAGLDVLASSYLKPIHKFFAVILCFACSFYCYMQSVRASNHASYMITLNTDEEELYGPESVYLIIRRGADFHTIGTRMFYLAFLMVLWIFGPIPVLVATILLVWHLWYLDGTSYSKNGAPIRPDIGSP